MSNAGHAGLDRAGHGGLVVTRLKKGVQPGAVAQRITAYPGRAARGTVRFVLEGHGEKQTQRVRIRRGRAVFRVPALTSGRYTVRAHHRGRHGSIGFRVYDSQIGLDATTFTVSASGYDSQYAAQITGSVRYRGRTAQDGYLDVYRDGDADGGRRSPSYLGFSGVATNGTFDYTRFGQDVVARYPPGTYTFVALYTPSASFADYVSSDVVTVTVVP